MMCIYCYNTFSSLSRQRLINKICTYVKHTCNLHEFCIDKTAAFWLQYGQLAERMVGWLRRPITHFAGIAEKMGRKAEKRHGPAMFGYRGLPVSKSRPGPLLCTLWHPTKRNIGAGAL